MKPFLVSLISLFLLSCTQPNKPWNKLSEKAPLDSFKQTTFSLTLENPVTPGKNTIYTPAFLFAWSQVEQKLGSDIVLGDSNSNDLQLVSSSESYLRSLSGSEYSASAEIIDDAIVAHAFFNKTLPFEKELQTYGQTIRFGGKSVTTFGMPYYNEAIVWQAKILYYLDDDHFVLKLFPKDSTHEIILAKGLESFTTLSGALSGVTRLVHKGSKEARVGAHSWKYELVDGDIFLIPVIDFNIATNYESLEGQRFLTRDGKKHFIDEATQRTAFILNEKGAVVESEVMVLADTALVEPVLKHPKRLVFDKPFLIVVKKVKETNPYFVMSIVNAELLTRRK